MNITDILKPIKLLKGSHPNTGETGSGCLMNVVSYLNGDQEITDRPACACPVVMPIAIWLNDYMNDDERQQLLPFVERISGSRTYDVDVLTARALVAARFEDVCAKSATKHAAKYAEYAKYAKYAESAKYAAKYSKYAKYDAKYARHAAESAAKHAAKYAAIRHELISAALKCLDEMLPVQSKPDDVVIERARKLVEIANEPI